MKSWVGFALLIPPLNGVLDVFGLRVEVQCKFIRNSGVVNGGQGREIVEYVFWRFRLFNAFSTPQHA
jgi:hypothetical protein